MCYDEFNWRCPPELAAPAKSAPAKSAPAKSGPASADWSDRVLGELLEVVSKMRAAQRDYFKSRSFAALERSKGLERSVDDMVARIRGGQMELGL